jgi:hypothetical protein
VWCHHCLAIDQPSIGTSLLKRSRLCLPLSPLAHAAVVPPCRRVERRPRPCRVRTGGHAVRRPWPCGRGRGVHARGARITSLGSDLSRGPAPRPAAWPRCSGRACRRHREPRTVTDLKTWKDSTVGKTAPLSGAWKATLDVQMSVQ